MKPFSKPPCSASSILKLQPLGFLPNHFCVEQSSRRPGARSRCDKNHHLSEHIPVLQLCPCFAVAPFLRETIILQHLPSPRGSSGHTHDTVFFLLDSQYLIPAFLTEGVHHCGLQVVHDWSNEGITLSALGRPKMHPNLL